MRQYSIFYLPSITFSTAHFSTSALRPGSIVFTIPYFEVWWSGVNPFLHFLTTGKAKNISPHPGFIPSMKTVDLDLFRIPPFNEVGKSTSPHNAEQSLKGELFASCQNKARCVYFFRLEVCCYKKDRHRSRLLNT